MESALKKQYHSIEEYLELEQDAEFRSEYYEGEIFAMSGGSSNHSLIAGNLIYALNGALRDKDCYVFTSDLKLRIELADAFVYPDVMVVCGEREYYQDRKDIIQNPKVVIEVLSPSTATFNRRGKFRRYEKLPSLQEYILVEQDFPRVEVFKRAGDIQWLFTPHEDLNIKVLLDSLGIEFPLSEVYRKVVF